MEVLCIQHGRKTAADTGVLVSTMCWGETANAWSPPNLLLGMI